MALLVAIVALLASGLAIIYTRSQAHAMQLTNAPEVSLCTGLIWRTGQPELECLQLTFTGNQVRRAEVSIVGGPADLIGLPNSTEARSTSVVLSDPVAGHAIDLPVHYPATQAGLVVLAVDMRGDGFGRVRRRVSVDVTPPAAY